ncbi:MAG: protoporphyrinogen oxidase HemJ [Gammaproteobacteria bacterium]|nr:MAG: protoporphyrinogen oxidase HemJ [Gammaproteobacteria bacterium]
MLWLKAIHIMAVVSWFAGLFYLPRLFVYHAMTEDQTGKDRFKIMERKLYRGIMTPAMIATYLFGFWIVALSPGAYFAYGWFHAKLLIVLLLTLYHFWCGRLIKVFAEDANTRSHVWYRFFNELPTLGLIGAVILVVVRPF